LNFKVSSKNPRLITVTAINEQAEYHNSVAVELFD